MSSPRPTPMTTANMTPDIDRHKRQLTLRVYRFSQSGLRVKVRVEGVVPALLL